MSLTEALLRDTLARAGETVASSPELLDHVRAAIVRAERRRRAIAVAVVIGTFLLTVLALFVLVSIRS